MHDGCSGSFNSGRDVVDKIRSMGFHMQPMPVPLSIACAGCGEELVMETFECRCGGCGMVHGVTPCHSFDPRSVMAAGVDY